MFHAKNYLNWPMFHGLIQKITLAQFFETRCICCTAGVDKPVRSTNLYHYRQCGIVLTPRSSLIDYTVVCFMAHYTAAGSCENTVRPVRAECGLNKGQVILTAKADWRVGTPAVNVCIASYVMLCYVMERISFRCRNV